MMSGGPCRNAGVQIQPLPIDFRYFLVFRNPKTVALVWTLETVLSSSRATSAVLMFLKSFFSSLISDFDHGIRVLSFLRLAICSLLNVCAH